MKLVLLLFSLKVTFVFVLSLDQASFKQNRVFLFLFFLLFLAAVSFPPQLMSDKKKVFFL